MNRGSEIPIKATILNQGGNYDGTAINIRYFYSTDQFIDGGDVEIGDPDNPEVFAQALSSGESATVNNSLTLPNIDVGTYFIGVIVDSDEDIAEADEFNNTRFSDSAFSLEGDLTVRSVTFPAPAGPFSRGDALDDVIVQVANESFFDYPAGTDISILLHLSLDEEFDNTDDIFLATVTFADGLDGSATTDQDVDTVIPDDAPPGSYFAAAKVNFASVEESDFTNNVGFSDAADIVVAAVSIAEALEDHAPPSPVAPVISVAGDSSWYAQDTTFQTLFAAQSGAIDDNESTSFEFTLTLDNPTTVSFDWSVDSEPGFDTLSFTVNGETVTGTIDAGAPESILPISGSVAFETVEIELIPGEHTLRFEYAKDFIAEDGADAAWVDELTVTPEVGPDFILAGLTFDEGEFIVGLASITITATGTNVGDVFVGDPSGLPADFAVEAKLSPSQDFVDPGAVSLGTLSQTNGLEDNNLFIYRETFAIPDTLDEGACFVVLNISTAEPEVSKDNNAIASDTASVTIVRLPDLAVDSADFSSGVLLIGDDVLDFTITVSNGGKGGVPAEAFNVTVTLSTDANIGDGADVVAIEFADPTGLDVGFTRTYRATTEIPAGVDIGVPYFVNVEVDSDSAITEMDELNNNLLSDSADLVFGELSIPDAVDNTVDFTEATFPDDQPWVGQTVTSFDGVDAAQSVAIGDGENSSFSVSVIPTGTPIVSFYWKVSSEFNGDFLSFYIDGALQESIAGEVDFTFASFPLTADLPNELTWTYSKNSVLSAGADTAWVDMITIAAQDNPDFTLLGLTSDTGTFVAGEAVLNVTATGANIGESLPGGLLPADFRIQVRLSPSTDFDDPDAVDLGDLQQLDDLNQDDLFVFQDSFAIGAGVAPGDYFLVLRIDGGVTITELNTANNDRSSSFADITVQSLPDLVVSAVTFAGGLIDRAQTDPLQIGITIDNNGAGDIPESELLVQLVLTANEDIGDQNDVALVTFAFGEGLAAGSGRTFNSVFPSPTTLPLELLSLSVPKPIAEVSSRNWTRRTTRDLPLIRLPSSTKSPSTKPSISRGPYSARWIFPGLDRVRSLLTAWMRDRARPSLIAQRLLLISISPQWPATWSLSIGKCRLKWARTSSPSPLTVWSRSRCPVTPISLSLPPMFWPRGIVP